MKTFHLASYNRASDGAIQKLKDELENLNALTSESSADYIIAVGDRTETFDVVLKYWRSGVPIIHLWAGESCGDWATEDEVYRTAMTLMSMLQLCTNETAKQRVELICSATKKKPNAHVIGNLMMDDLSIDESIVPKEPYVLILYNPSTLLGFKKIKEDIEEILSVIKTLKQKPIWIEPNGDQGSYLVSKYINQMNLPRSQFLGLLKHCQCFITNSSSQYYEAPFFLKKNQVISVGSRNTGRESKDADMRIPGATKKIIKLLEKL